MEVKYITNADINKVFIKEEKPHCIKHGAMNKITKDGIWRCISTHCIQEIRNGNAVSKKEIDNNCDAGCQEI